MHAIFPKNTSRPNKVILGGTGVPISELLKRQECFQPTEVATLCAVFEDVLKTLGLVDRRDVLTTMIARKLVELAKTGVRDPVRLKQRTLRAFEAGKPTRSVPTVRIV
jgi:hypothetical protein